MFRRYRDRTTSTSDDSHADAGSPTVSLASPTEAPRPNTAMTTPREPEISAARTCPFRHPWSRPHRSLHPVLEPVEPTQGSRPAVDTALPGNPFAWRSFTAMIVTCWACRWPTGAATWLRPTGRDSGQSAGTGTTIVIASRRVGMHERDLPRRASAIRNRPSSGVQPDP